MPVVFQKAAESGNQVVFGDGDIGNVGGMNAYLSHTGTDVHLREIFKILKEEMGSAYITRKKGDELTFVRYNTTAKKMQEDLARTRERIHAYAEKTPIVTIEVRDKNTNEILVPEGTKMMLSDIPHPKGGPGGTSIYGAFVDYKGGDVNHYIDRLAVKSEAEKGSVAHGRRQAKNARVAASAGEAGGVDGGVETKNGLLGTDTGISGRSGGEGSPEARQDQQPAKFRNGKKLKPPETQPPPLPPEATREYNPGAVLERQGSATNIPVSMEDRTGGKNPISNHEIIDSIKRDMQIPIHAGRMGRTKALAHYKIDANTIETRREHVGDLGVVTHEIAHGIDGAFKFVDNLTPALKRELGALDYDPKQQRPEEGFAEFTRHYLTDDTVRKMVPNVARRFEEFIASEPALRRNMEKWKGEIEQWKAQGAVKRMDADNAYAGKDHRTFSEKWNTTKKMLREAFDDRLASVEDFQNELESKRKEQGLPALTADQKIYEYQRRQRGFAAGAAEDALNNSPKPVSVKPITSSTAISTMPMPKITPVIIMAGDMAAAMAAPSPKNAAPAKPMAAPNSNTV
jgi:hypothetical protein